MEVKRKRILSQLVIHIFMFVSGLEYAIIFPTIWEYLQSLGVDKEQTYWLGLVISAMTMTDMISGLIIGRVVDIYTNTRLLVLVLNLFQIGGGIIYCCARSAVALVLARLLSGCGKSISVAFLADLCRYTSKSERTSVLLVLNISQQIGLVLGPGMNLILDYLNIHITKNFSITKLNAPGLVMAALWTFVSFLVLLFYFDLVKLASEELITDQLDQGYLSSETIRENMNLYSDDSDSIHSQQRLSMHHSEEELEDFNEQQIESIRIQNREGGESCSPGPRLPLILSPPPGVTVAGTSHLLTIPAIDCFKARSRGTSGADFSIGHSSNNSQGSGYGSTDHQLVPSSYQSELSLHDQLIRPRIRRASWDVRVDPIRLLRRSKRKSEKYIIEAERFIADENNRTFSNFDASRFSSRNVSVAQTESSMMSSSSGGWNEYKEHIAKPEICILIFIRFIVLFCQTSLEAIVPPVMNTIFQYDDSANSYLYLAAAFEFIVVFGILTLLTRWLTDRAIVRAGLCLSLVALIWHSCTIPNFTTGDRSQVKYFGIGAFLQLLGCPVVSEIGLALFSKLVPEHVQGMAHGIRRFFSQLAVLLGPLWGPTTLTIPLLMTLLPLGLQLVAIILFIAWYSKMLPTNSDSVDENTPLLT